MPPPRECDICYEWVQAVKTTAPIDLFHNKHLVQIVANVPIERVPPGSSKKIEILFDDKGTGTFPIGRLVTRGDNSYEFSTGSVTVSYYKRGRIKGTFQATATDFSSPEKEITITNGQFDIKIK